MNKVKTIKYFFAVSFAMASWCFIFSLNAFDKNFYFEEYEINGVFEKIEQRQLEEQTTKLLNFLQGRGELDRQFFNEQEIKHLQDVRLLFVWAGAIYWLGIISLFVSVYQYKKIIKIKTNDIADLSFLCGAVIVGSVFLSGLLGLNFSRNFDLFHRLFFSPGTWLFDPATDNLIIMFPQKFFQAIASKMLVDVLLIGAACLAVAGLMKWRLKVKNI